MGRTNRNLIISLLLLAVSLVTVSVVLADYLGPDRTTTVVVWRRLRCSYLAVYDPSGSGYYSCTYTRYETPSAGCPSTSSIDDLFNPAASACGASWPGTCGSTISCNISLSSSTEGCSDGESGCEGSTQTVSQPPATVSGSIACAAPGSNGWCQSAASIYLNGSEPLSGYAITALEGTRNGTTFACSGSSCSVDLLEGQNDFTYWALSSWGDSSEMGSSSGRVDTQPPAISGALTGTTGDNGWYVSDVTVSASASDSLSGLQSFEINVNGGGYQTYAETTLGEGTHTIDLRAVDNAGHVSTASQSFSVDTTAPVLALSSGGSSFCPGCGDVLSLSYDVQDALSGISQWTLSASGAVIASNTIAGSAIVDWGGSGLEGGTHTLTLSARDAAGNQSTTSLSIVLNTPPVPTQTRVRMIAPTPTPRPVVPLIGPAEPGLAQREPSRLTFESAPPEPQRALVQPEQTINSTQPASPQATASPVLWGGAAAGLIGAAMVVAMEAQRKRKEEEARAIAEMNRINADSRAREKGYQSHADMVEKQRQAAWDAAFLAALAAEQQRKALEEERKKTEGEGKGGKKVHAMLIPPVNKFYNSASKKAELHEELDEVIDSNANWVGIKYQTMGIKTVAEVDVDFPILTKVAANKWAWRAPVKYVRHEAVITKITSVDIGNDDLVIVQNYFNRVDPHIDINIQKYIYYDYLRDGTRANVPEYVKYGNGKHVWDELKKNIEDPGQYLDLKLLFSDPYSIFASPHYNLCGELAVLAALGIDLKEGLEFFKGLTFQRYKIDKYGEIIRKKDGTPETYNISGKDILKNGWTTSAGDLMLFMNKLIDLKVEKYVVADYRRTINDFNNAVLNQKPMIALVNLNKKTGFLQGATKSTNEVAHWVTILDVVQNHKGDKFVLVYNPFNNQNEFYNWDTFDAAWKETYFKDKSNSSYLYIKPEG